MKIARAKSAKTTKIGKPLSSAFKSKAKDSEQLAPSVRLGKKAGNTAQGDFIEVEVHIQASINYQVAGASVRFRTSDPALLPLHGDNSAAIVKKITEVSSLATTAIGEKYDEIRGCVVNIAEDAAEWESVHGKR